MMQGMPLPRCCRMTGQQKPINVIKFIAFDSKNWEKFFCLSQFYNKRKRDPPRDKFATHISGYHAILESNFGGKPKVGLV